MLPLLLLLAAGPVLREEPFELAQASEVIAILTASCERCAWGREGREAAALSLAVDGRYSQHLLLLRGTQPAEYRVALGTQAAGRHRLSVSVDRESSAPGVRGVSLEKLELQATPEGAGEHTALALAPVLEQPADAPPFTRVPLLLWYESEPTPRGRRLRYMVLLSGAGETAAPDRLMAVWGRATEILTLLEVELDAAGRVLSERLPGPGDAHPFTGPHLVRRPVLRLGAEGATAGAGGEASRSAPAPFAFGLAGAPREAVMDVEPWTYRVMIQELARRGRLVADARQGSGRIPDPRRFAYVEACAELEGAALSLAVGVAGRGGRLRWRESDDAGPAFRITRSGCFRSAVALGSVSETRAIRALRFRAFARSSDAARARVTRVNRLFLLQSDGLPGPSLFRWSGELPLRLGEPSHSLDIEERP